VGRRGKGDKPTLKREMSTPCKRRKEKRKKTTPEEEKREFRREGAELQFVLRSTGKKEKWVPFSQEESKGVMKKKNNQQLRTD